MKTALLRKIISFSCALVCLPAVLCNGRSALPAYVPQAFVATEDRRFYEHNGVDLKGIAAAVAGKIVGNNRGGASTRFGTKFVNQVYDYLQPVRLIPFSASFNVG